MPQSSDKFKRQASSPVAKRAARNAREAEDPPSAAEISKRQDAKNARELRREQRRRRKEMGKPQREDNEMGEPCPPRSPAQGNGRHVPLVRSLSKDIDWDEKRRLAETQQADKDKGEEEDEVLMTASGEDGNDQNVVVKPPVKIRSVGYTTSEGATGHANEDRFVVRSSDAFHLFAAIDGHGGHKAAEYLVDHLFATLESVYTQQRGFANKKEIQSAIEALDTTFLAVSARDEDDSGACFNAVVLYWDKDSQCHQRMVLNCGDCRSIAREAPEKLPLRSHKGIHGSRSSSWHCDDDRMSTPVISLSEDHSVSNRAEKLRVLEAGAFIRNRRIAGILEPFRSIGDLDMKGKKMQGWVIPTPEIRESELAVARTTIVVATDGVWSVLSNQRAMVVALQEFADGGDAQTAAEAIADEARAIGSSDDITVVVVSV
jgi:serine/threonine protein phosphatase PrpC